MPSYIIPLSLSLSLSLNHTTHTTCTFAYTHLYTNTHAAFLRKPTQAHMNAITHIYMHRNTMHIALYCRRASLEIIPRMTYPSQTRTAAVASQRAVTQHHPQEQPCSQGSGVCVALFIQCFFKALCVCMFVQVIQKLCVICEGCQEGA